jgi:hypothetical protein
MNDQQVAYNDSFDLTSLGDPVEYMLRQNTRCDSGKQGVGRGDGMNVVQGSDYGIGNSGLASPATKAARPPP